MVFVMGYCRAASDCPPTRCVTGAPPGWYVPLTRYTFPSMARPPGGGPTVAGSSGVRVMCSDVAPEDGGMAPCGRIRTHWASFVWNTPGWDAPDMLMS